MKTAIVFAAVLLLAVVPVADARHVGPCWHEYIDGIKDFRATVKDCLQRDTDRVRELVRVSYLA